MNVSNKTNGATDACLKRITESNPLRNVGIEKIFGYLGMDDANQIFKTARIERYKSINLFFSTYMRELKRTEQIAESGINNVQKSGQNYTNPDWTTILSNTQAKLTQLEMMLAIPTRQAVVKSEDDNSNNHGFFEKLKTAYYNQLSNIAEYRAYLVVSRF